MAQIDELLEQAEAQESADSWVLITKYQHKEFYVDSDRAVNIAGRKIEAIKEEVSVQGENHSQYIEFIMDRYYDGIDISEQTLAIHYEVGDASDEDAPINVYKNDMQIKFGWVVENSLTQHATTVEFCIWARGTLADGNAYVLKTLPQKYEIQRGLTIAGGIIEPSNNWYTQFALTMDEKVSQASESADRAVQVASSVDGVVEIVTTARDEVAQKSSTVNTQHSEVESWRQEVEQFRNEAEQFRDEAFATTPDGYAEVVKNVEKNTIKIDTIIEKAELNIKNTASGKNIHLTDSANSKVVEFGLYGKATQDGEPTTDNPIEIVVSGSDGSVEVVSCRKNLLKNTAESTTTNGVTFTVNKDGSVSCTGQPTTWTNFKTNNSFILKKGTYKFSSGANFYNPYIRIMRWSDSKDLYNSRKGDIQTIVVEEECECFAQISASNSYAFTQGTIYPMIRLASDTDDTFEPYTETLSTIPIPNGLAGIKVSSGGNYTDENGQQWVCDEIVKYADGRGKRIQRIGKAVFDGSDDEEWSDRTSEYTEKIGNQRRYSTVDIEEYRLIQNVPCISSIGYVGTIAGKTTYSDNGLYLYWLPNSTDRIAYVTIDNEDVTDLNTFKSWLASNPITVYYELATPIITDLSAEEITEIEKLHTFYPITNISNDSDCGMAVTYMADAKNYIDNRLALLETALVNSI